MLKNYWFFLLFLFITNSLLAQDSFDLLKKELDQTLANEALYLNTKNKAINLKANFVLRQSMKFSFHSTINCMKNTNHINRILL